MRPEDHAKEIESIERRADEIMRGAVLDQHRESLTEDGLALSFCEAYPNQRYVARWGHWLVWDGARWREDDTLAVFDRIRQHARRAVGMRTEKAVKALTRAQGIAAIERLAKTDRRYAATVDQWDGADWIINTPGGMVDLRNGVLHKHDPDAYLTKVTSATPEGDCPHWQQFLREVTGNDVDYVDFLQRVAGYAATGSTAEHALFFLYGTGGNGKGTFLNTLQAVLADYAVVAPMEVFTESRTDRHPTELAMLRGARLVLAQETEEGRAWAESRIKALTGGDPVTARYMRQDFFTFEPKFKLLIAGNHKPALRNVDEAIRRRLHLLPFSQTFKGRRLDSSLPEKLRAEADGILNWIIAGTRAYLDEGLNPPRVVTEATAEYFSAEDLFTQWLTDCCDMGAQYWEPSGRLFESWKRYADAANEKPGSRNAFAERLRGAGLEPGRSNTQGRHYKGLRIKYEAVRQDDF